MNHIWNVIVLSLLISSIIIGGPVLTTITTAYYWIAAITLTISIPFLVIGFMAMEEKEKYRVTKNIKFSGFIWNVCYLVVFAFLGWTYVVALQILLLVIIISILHNKFKEKESHE